LLILLEIYASISAEGVKHHYVLTTASPAIFSVVAAVKHAFRNLNC